MSHSAGERKTVRPTPHQCLLSRCCYTTPHSSSFRLYADVRNSDDAMHHQRGAAFDPAAGFVVQPPSQSGGGSGTKKKGNSIAGLLAELEGSYDDLGTIRTFCDDSDSSTALEKVTPQEFGNILKVL